MQLSPAAFNGWLRNIGQDLAWRQAFACPCINPASGASKPNCPLCNGKGRQWNDEVVGRAGFQSLAPKKGFAAFGTWEPGDATLTIGSDCPFYIAGQYDRFRSLNSTAPFSTHLVRGEADVLLGTVETISRVFWLNTAGDTVIEGGIPTVNEDGTMTWTTGEPPDGQTYSISGVKYEEWFCYMDMPGDRAMHAGAALPKKLAVRKFDIFAR
ncbi:MAG: hypothetical protein JWL86_504 [Rhizobium sp.]|nr:hypothetical protein [Rhizobium sp.]